jgi:hypothetical protein
MELDGAVQDLREVHGHDLRVDGVDEEVRVHYRLPAQRASRIDRPPHDDRIPPRVNRAFCTPAEQPGAVQGARRASVDSIEQRQQPELFDRDRHAGGVGAAGASALDHECDPRVVVAVPGETALFAAITQHLEDCLRHTINVQRYVSLFRNVGLRL